MMIDFNKPVQTRDGREVRVLCTDGPYKDYPVVGYVISEVVVFQSWCISGARWPTTPSSHDDLINVPDTRVVWVNVHPVDKTTFHATREIADSWAEPDRLARIRVPYTVGQFDEEPDA